jgi:sRNA-binding carbon storage regulator CsrA
MLVLVRRRGESVLVGKPGEQVEVVFVGAESAGRIELGFRDLGQDKTPVVRAEVAAADAARAARAAKGGAA